MSGYLDMPEETRTALRDGWFYGGDRGWLDAECRRRLAAYKVPVEYHVLPALPRNATGKVVKEELTTSLQP
jgi:acyl-CoA synthetase (AMP-forming)/AMP-acid ligase II